jgi:ubiquinone biosynthesis protein COQ4
MAMSDKTRVERMVERRRRWYYLKNNLMTLYATVRLAINPQATRYVFVIGDTQDNIAEPERVAGRFPDPFESEALEALWRSGFRAARYDLEELGRLPPHTLGGAYARHMQANKLSVDYYQERAPRNRMQFMRQRMRQTHDVWHVLTGFGTDEFEEVGIQGFYAGQFTSSMSGIIGAGAFMKSIVKCRFGELAKHMDAFCEGYCAGKRAENLLAVKWEELWGESLESLRRRYRIDVPGRTQANKGVGLKVAA